MGFSRLILRLAGWKVRVMVPDYPKAIICVAPHTSNWDFIIGKLAYASVNRKAGFLMKKSWFFFLWVAFFVRWEVSLCHEAAKIINRQSTTSCSFSIPSLV